MKAGRLYCFNILQIVGLGVQFWNWRVGCAVILGGCLGEIAYISSAVWERQKFKPCPQCGTCVPGKVRICPECGYQYKKGFEETEILDHIEQERDKVDVMTSEEIDCNFEKVEEFVLDEVTSFDGDIEEFLDRRSGEGFLR
jgi:hypothetical protein